jgi:hypothetical protein
VLERLADAGVLNVRYTRSRLEAAELTHDYLVARLDAIVDEIRLIWPQRLLSKALARFAADGRLATPVELDEIVTALRRLDLGGKPADAAELLLRSALAAERHGLETFDFCSEQGIHPMETVERFVSGEDRDLGATAVTLLIKLIKTRETVRPAAFGLLAEMVDDPAHTARRSAASRCSRTIRRTTNRRFAPWPVRYSWISCAGHSTSAA